MARTNRILNLSECNAYEAPYSEKEHKLALRMLPNIFPLILMMMDMIYVTIL